MKFSFIATCYNEIKGLQQWRRDIEIQTKQPDEIVIVDSESNDGTTELLKNWSREDSRVKVVVEKCNPARGRNIAIEQAAYERIVCTDMGVRLDPLWFEALTNPIEKNPEIDVVKGNSRIDKKSARTPASRIEYYINGDTPVINDKNVHERLRPGNRSVCYTKTLWRKLGGLPEDLTFYADDVVFGRQIVNSGCKMVNAPDAMTYWCKPPHLNDYWREKFNYGRGNGEALIKMPFAVKMHLKIGLPRVLIKTLTAVRFLQLQTKFNAYKKAIKNRDMKALLLMPVFSFGQGWYYAEGYLTGKSYGDKYCAGCRSRNVEKNVS